MKKYHIYLSVKDWLEDTNNYTIGYDLTEQQMIDHEICGRLVVGPVSTLIINNASRFDKRNLKK